MRGYAALASGFGVWFILIGRRGACWIRMEIVNRILFKNREYEKVKMSAAVIKVNPRGEKNKADSPPSSPALSSIPTVPPPSA